LVRSTAFREKKGVKTTRKAPNVIIRSKSASLNRRMAGRKGAGIKLRKKKSKKGWGKGEGGGQIKDQRNEVIHHFYSLGLKKPEKKGKGVKPRNGYRGDDS